MKSKNIPPDIRIKSIKEAQNEINEIIKKLENKDVNLDNSIEKYNRMMKLNDHIEDQFRRKANEIRKSFLIKNKKKSSKNFK